MANTSANIANTVAKVSLVANSAPLANVETYVTIPLFLVAGNTANGDCFRIVLAGIRNDTEGYTYTYNVKAGSAGSIADPNVLSVKNKRYVGDNNQTFFDEFVITVRSNTSTGNIVAVATNSGTPVIGGNVAYNATVNNYIGVSFATSDKYANVIFTTAVAHQLI